MNTYFFLYLLTRLDSLNFMLAIIIIVSLILVFILGVVGLASEDDFFYFFKKRYLLIPTIALILATLIPTKNEAIVIIAGGKTIEWAKQDSSLQKLPEQTTLLISNYLEKQINELEKQNKEKK